MKKMKALIWDRKEQRKIDIDNIKRVGNVDPRVFVVFHSDEEVEKFSRDRYLLKMVEKND